MEKIKAIIVDDEPEARDIMANLLADFGDVEVLAKDESVDEAFRSISRHKPDLIFLDIDMPNKDGFQLIRKLKGIKLNPAIIFVTAYNQFAISAIKHAAFDYLLKPVDIDELKQSLQRYKEDVRAAATLSRIENLLQALQEEKIRFSSRTGTIYINPAEIIYCRADGNYSDLYLTGRDKQTVTLSIGRLEDLLPAPRFMKISRSLIINRQYLAEVNRKEKVCKLEVNDECLELNVSAKYIQKLIED